MDIIFRLKPLTCFYACSLNVDGVHAVLMLNCYNFNIFSCQAVPFFLGAIAVEYILCFLTNVPRTRLNDAYSSIAAGIFSQLSK